MRGEDTMSSGSIVEVVIDPVDNELSSASRKGAHTRDDRLPLSGVPVPNGMGYASEARLVYLPISHGALWHTS